MCVVVFSSSLFLICTCHVDLLFSFILSLFLYFNVED